MKAPALWIIFTTALTIVLAVFLSPITALAVLIGILCFGVALLRPLWILAGLALYFPLEPFVLKFVPDHLFVYARFFPEVLLYGVAGVAIVSVLASSRRTCTPLDLPFALFLVTMLASIVINLLPPETALLGARQILRFPIVYFAAVYLHPSRTFMKRLTIALLALALAEAGLGILQAIVGERLDTLLFPSEGRFFGELTLAPNAFRFWDPGSRVFATLGRYDRLATFLSFALLLGAGILYEMRHLVHRFELRALFLLGLPALVLTYSRSGWFGFVLGFLLIGFLLKRDMRVRVALVTFLLFTSAYVLFSGVVVSRLIDVPRQGVAERFFEAFSLSRWQGEYYGLGRLFWIVNTPLHVVPAAPLFGHGPGQFGGGAVLALRNTRVYDMLGLPFGVGGTEGYIDNNWLSLWGETGTLGLIFYLWMFAALGALAARTWRGAHDPFARAMALGFMGIIVAMSIHAFLASFLETRTLAYHFWLYGGFVTVLGRKEGVL
ncbi:O-antigen ligase family protein [Candidatus Uhrbacteria bacterium]|nr:O-antigen ligase family protein [Candidatus Uhrbacteria bacterium]